MCTSVLKASGAPELAGSFEARISRDGPQQCSKKRPAVQVGVAEYVEHVRLWDRVASSTQPGRPRPIDRSFYDVTALQLPSQLTDPLRSRPPD